MRTDGFLHRLEVAEAHEIEAVGAGSPKPSRYFSLPAAAMVASVRPWKAPLKVMIRHRSGCAVGEVIAARQLDGALAGFRAGIAEEHLVGEGHLAQPLGEPLLAGDAVEIGAVPQLAAPAR